MIMFIFQSAEEKCEISHFSLGCWSPVMKELNSSRNNSKNYVFCVFFFSPIFFIYTIIIMIHIKTPYVSRVHCFISM